MNSFDTAVTTGHLELADYLIHRGADISAPHLYPFNVKGAAGPCVTILDSVLTGVILEVHNYPRRGEMLQYLLNLSFSPLECPK